MAATDRDWDSVFDLFYKIAYDFAYDASETKKPEVSEEVEKKARMAILRSEADEPDKKGFLFSVYGFKGVLPRDEFVAAVCRKEN